LALTSAAVRRSSSGRARKLTPLSCSPAASSIRCRAGDATHGTAGERKSSGVGDGVEEVLVVVEEEDEADSALVKRWPTWERKAGKRKAILATDSVATIRVWPSGDE
jgi:hypothetical protein